MSGPNHYTRIEDPMGSVYALIDDVGVIIDLIVKVITGTIF